VASRITLSLTTDTSNGERATARPLCRDIDLTALSGSLENHRQAARIAQWRSLPDMAQPPGYNTTG
jgi:hypothetical protein